MAYKFRSYETGELTDDPTPGVAYEKVRVEDEPEPEVVETEAEDKAVDGDAENKELNVEAKPKRKSIFAKKS